eukprot:Blabericola_migrator_1__1855@NODE_1503_length_4395_cov_463_061691_g986_i0_p2_GENE_NODE_1503_length_4395_cov_463_061691_g986_i0NODE_1503_length_4395_cov_463_061691_g986_i0_p2_ORF_typecomplete_len319_score70_57PhoD/PF09423_10/0_00014_NODE_1503_length_4395_cov_463_061691_g986_i026233579
MIGNETDFGLFKRVAEIDYEDYMVAKTAYRVYAQYQRALTVDPPHHETDEYQSDVMVHWAGRIFPQVGLIVLDWRLPCTFGKESSELRMPYDLLGPRQRHSIVKRLIKSFKNVAALLVVSPVRLSDPDAFVHDKNVHHGAKWLLEHLFQWRDAAPRNTREVVLLSGAPRGDHGGIVEITRNNNTHAIKEFSAGPITTTGWLDKEVNGSWGHSIWPFKKTQWRMGHYKMKRVSKIASPNYALLAIGHKWAMTDNMEDAIEHEFMVSKPVVWCQHKAVKEVCLKHLQKSPKDLSMACNVRPAKINVSKPVSTVPKGQFSG